MPAESVAQRQAMAIAEHDPEQLYARNKSLLQMSKSQLHDFASTKEKGLPQRKSHAPRGNRKGRS
jgi:hypothetical protein